MREIREAAPEASASEAQLTAAWDVRGIDVASVSFDKGTAVARRHLAAERPWLETLPSLLASGPEGTAPQFRLGELLGEGGMGVVRAAEQVALAREVAIKSPREAVEAAVAASQLLREARVTGVLEHPNVVPIHAFGRDDDGQPLLVMRRVQGDSWADLLARATERTSDTYLRRHLAILHQVALAVHFAHDKGVLHRDLKPDNVMVGAYGEIYVLDWGIAVSLRDDLSGVPRSREVAHIEGTPAYMAPEMAAGDGEVIEARTDVYLLGAILHEIVAGRPPHEGSDLVSMLTHAFMSDPVRYPPEVPRDLAAICHQAMARHPADRHASAAAFAEALDEFLVHRSSTELSDEADKRLLDLGGLLDEAIGVAAASDQARSERVYATFRECRFAYAQALRSWPGNVAATHGLQRALEMMIAFELARDAPQAAAGLLAELPVPVEALAREVDRALERHRSAQSKLEALEHDADLRIGEHLRRPISFVLAVAWAVVCIVCGYLTRSGVHPVSQEAFSGVNGVFAFVVAVSAYVGRDQLLVNAANRRLLATAFMVFAGYVALWLVAGRLGIAASATAAIHCIFGMAMWVAASINVERRWLPIAAGSFVGLMSILIWPERYFDILGVTGGIGSVSAAVWSRRDEAPSSRAAPSRHPSSPSRGRAP